MRVFTVLLGTQHLSCFLIDYIFYGINVIWNLLTCMSQCYTKESDTEKTDHPSSLAEESDHDSHSKGSTPKNRHSKEVSSQHKRVQSSDEEEEERTEEEKQQELVS